jgi:hypothetical protein
MRCHQITRVRNNTSRDCIAILTGHCTGTPSCPPRRSFFFGFNRPNRASLGHSGPRKEPTITPLSTRPRLWSMSHQDLEDEQGQGLGRRIFSGAYQRCLEHSLSSKTRTGQDYSCGQADSHPNHRHCRPQLSVFAAGMTSLLPVADVYGLMYSVDFQLQFPVVFAGVNHQNMAQTHHNYTLPSQAGCCGTNGRVMDGLVVWIVCCSSLTARWAGKRHRIIVPYAWACFPQQWSRDVGTSLVARCNHRTKGRHVEKSRGHDQNKYIQVR